MTVQQQYAGQPQSSSGWERVPVHLAYDHARKNIAELLGSCPEAAPLGVPSCPQWTVRDMVAHLVVVCGVVTSDAVTDPASIPAAVAESVQAHEGVGVAELLVEWEQLAERIEALAERDGRRARVVTMDAFTHEVDLRQVLDAPVPADHPAYPVAFEVLTDGLSASVNANGLPAFSLRAPGAEWTVGEGAPVATLRGSRHDLHRSLAGRRTAAQIAALDWSAPAEPWLQAFAWGPFSPPAEAAEAAEAMESVEAVEHG
ncbi:maleylpyruvate isomerase family mycothiol-dependent enzyme [Kitasatospora sp. GP82]|uniref:maleylpyruvate isomerase family mycothiol-dependent enzyme n=1 Tax=Kitasatospora sp. GP82 TaxID=3035089 RepID=UPI0024732BD5|nr:maleylpyruvate isomerase family mycothiol-dependent enzyme [Kitasatospora sp. GP82]MDH6128776.1 uncharacterized protein (TIGR03083 family) [Kitasatospora sp. GP82]